MLEMVRWTFALDSVGLLLNAWMFRRVERVFNGRVPVEVGAQQPQRQEAQQGQGRGLRG
jgi:hypothetical protein